MTYAVCSVPFNQRQERVRLEAEAVLLILRRVEAGQLAWLTSEVVDYEIAQTPDAERALKASLLTEYAAAKILIDDDATARAAQLENLGFGGYDALHLACAESGQADIFSRLMINCSNGRRVMLRTCRCASSIP